MTKNVRKTPVETMGEEYEKILREAFEQTPILMVGDFARVVKEVTGGICDEYIKKSDDFQKLWALETVCRMMEEANAEKGGEDE